MTHDESITRYQNLTESLGEPVWRGDLEADAFNRFGKAPGHLEDKEKRMRVIHGFLLEVEKEIILASLKSTVDSLYYIYDHKELVNSRFRLEPKRIPGHAANLLCQSACEIISRKELIQTGEKMVQKHLELKTPRFSIKEISEQLEINLEGLNSILNYRTGSGDIDLAAYQEHYAQLKSTFPGFLLHTKILGRHFGGPFSLEDYNLVKREFLNPHHETQVAPWKLKKALREHFENIRLKWQKFNHQSIFKFRWYDKLNLYGILNIVEGRDHFEEIPPYYERLLLLSKYMASAPMAVANVLNKRPSLYQHLCWIIEDMDRVTSSWYIQSSVNNLNGYVMPLTIGVLVFTAPFSTPAFVAGLILLNAVTAVDLVKRRGETRELERERDWHERAMGTGLETYHTREISENLNATIAKEKWMMGVILTMEIASLGMAKGFSVHAKKIAGEMSETQKVSKLMRVYERSPGKKRGPGKKNWRLIHARQETNSFINKVLSKNQNAYDKAMQEYPGKLISTRDINFFKLSFALNHAKKEEAMKLLLHSKTTGFGMAGLNIELGAEAIEQIIVHLNTPAMTDFTAVEILLRVMTHDY